MPTIEELHTAVKVAAPGWSYVPDTGYDPSKVAINPSSRKRQRTGPGEGTVDPTAAADWTLRQQTAAQRHFAELDRDNHKTHQIATPKTLLGDKKQSTNVKRILQSGKDFAYYLEEEEALLSQKGLTVSSESAAVKKAGPRSLKAPAAKRKSAVVASNVATMTSDISSQPTPETSRTVVQDVAGHSVTASEVAAREATLMDPGPPLSISSDEIDALLSAPPLTYNMARSEPPPASAPRPRMFCEICGFWGRVRCMKCGARVCSVVCKDTHDESRCVKFYA